MASPEPVVLGTVFEAGCAQSLDEFLFVDL